MRSAGPTLPAVVDSHVPAVAMRGRRVLAEIATWNNTGQHRIWRLDRLGRPYGPALLALPVHLQWIKVAPTNGN